MDQSSPPEKRPLTFEQTKEWLEARRRALLVEVSAINKILHIEGRYIRCPRCGHEVEVKVSKA